MCPAMLDSNETAIKEFSAQQILKKNCELPYLLISGQPRECNGGRTRRSSLHFCGQFGPVFLADLLSDLRNCLPFRNILYLFNYRGKEISRYFHGSGKITRQKNIPCLYVEVKNS